MISYRTLRPVLPSSVVKLAAIASGKALEVLLKPHRTENRFQRYLLLGAIGIASIWLLVAGYCWLLPRVYTSEMTIILPAARSSSTFSLDSIGQANTSSDSPFSSITSTPKVIYQSIAMSDEVLGAVAKVLGMDLSEFPKPRIDLVDETSLMMFKVYGPSPLESQHRAQIVLKVFLKKLDELREDEIERRSQGVRAGLSDVEANLKKARREILEFQQGSDVLSDDQMKIVTNQVEELRSKLDQVRADAARANGERIRLSEILEVTPVQAAMALRVQDDPQYAALLKDRTEAVALLATNAKRWGPNHPFAVAARSRLSSADSAFRGLAHADFGIDAEISLDKFLTTSKDRSELFRKLVELASEANGFTSNLIALQSALERQQNGLAQRNVNAARLADLERNHKIAEAVFGSTLARIDSGRSDIFGSYPLVQTMSPPTLPDRPTSPQPKVAIIGGLAATLLMLVAVWLAWIRRPFLWKHLASN